MGSVPPPPATLAATRRDERAGGNCVVRKLRGPIDQENRSQMTGRRSRIQPGLE